MEINTKIEAGDELSYICSSENGHLSVLFFLPSLSFVLGCLTTPPKNPLRPLDTVRFASIYFWQKKMAELPGQHGSHHLKEGVRGGVWGVCVAWTGNHKTSNFLVTYRPTAVWFGISETFLCILSLI